MENELPNRGRIPKEADLVALCRALNERGARYLIIGGFAVIHHGYLRATEDTHLLLDGDLGSQARVKARSKFWLTRQSSNWEMTICAITLSCVFPTKFWSIL
jgi:hypothetical protein